MPSKSVSIPRMVSTPDDRRISQSFLSRSLKYSAGTPVASPGSSDTGNIVHSVDSVHEDTLDLANVGFEEDEESSFAGPESPPKREFLNTTFSAADYLQNKQSFTNYGSIEDTASSSNFNRDIESLKDRPVSFLELAKAKIQNVQNADRDTLWEECVQKPLHCLPAVFLGTLLNILDALSYGMILFPLSELTFSKMGPSGLSMFYVSTVLCQLVFSLGGSAFKGAVGSEMIEIIPFFHHMAMSIMNKLKTSADDTSMDGQIITTTIFCYAISSIFTGLTFLALGKFKLGKLAGFFPRHILVGCIGGVGYFLLVTGIEVSSRLEGGFEYNWETLSYLLQPLRLIQWLIPLLLAALLVILQKFYDHPLLVPTFFTSVFVLFHSIVFFTKGWDLQTARDLGWVFPAQSSNEPWYQFYEYYDFGQCNWWLVLDELPTILAMTFFGILHVPINVPALALTSGVDDFDVDRELLAHGVSNFFSGVVGSIPNYLVYSNSVLFIRAGADSRLSGVLLGIATLGVLLAGPVIIGYIPVCVVGALIYLLGYELLKESVWDTIGRLRNFEYITILIIVVTMGALDFVIGIIVGILLACVSFVYDAGSRRVISEIYTGEYAKSVVVRHPKQQEFLKAVGKQICILKLSGSLFFGSIGGLESEIKLMFENQYHQIKYLILDLNNVQTIDFSAAEGFKRIRNLLIERDCYLLISSVEDHSTIVQSLKFCGLWEEDEHIERIQLFNNLNSALEWCENRFLQNYKDLVQQRQQQMKKTLPIQHQNTSIAIPKMSLSNLEIGTPRTNNFINAANKQFQSEQTQLTQLVQSKPNVQSVCDRKSSLTTKQPLYLILQIVQGLSNTTEHSFWSPLARYLVRKQYKPGELVYEKTDKNQPCLFFFEHGLINFQIDFNDLNFQIKSSQLPLTIFGDLVGTKSDRLTKYTAAEGGDCVVWTLDSKSIEKLAKEDEQLFRELTNVYIKITSQRFENIASNILIS